MSETGYLPLWWDGAPDFEVCYGHITTEAFVALCSEQGIEFEMDVVVKHRYATWAVDDSGENDWVIEFDDTPKSDNSPVTVAYY